MSEAADIPQPVLRGCFGKIAHATAAGAWTALRRQTKRARFRAQAGDRLGVYRCAACTLWHIGNSSNAETGR